MWFTEENRRYIKNQIKILINKGLRLDDVKKKVIGVLGDILKCENICGDFVSINTQVEITIEVTKAILSTTKNERSSFFRRIFLLDNVKFTYTTDEIIAIHRMISSTFSKTSIELVVKFLYLKCRNMRTHPEGEAYLLALEAIVTELNIYE